MYIEVLNTCNSHKQTHPHRNAHTDLSPSTLLKCLDHSCTVHVTPRYDGELTLEIITIYTGLEHIRNRKCQNNS